MHSHIKLISPCTKYIHKVPMYHTLSIPMIVLHTLRAQRYIHLIYILDHDDHVMSGFYNPGLAALLLSLYWFWFGRKYFWIYSIFFATEMLFNYKLQTTTHSQTNSQEASASDGGNMFSHPVVTFLK